MEEIKIIVADKIASVEGTPIIICGNGDYVVNFTFDDEWANKNKKTAHFVYYQDGLKKNIPVEFEGNTCNVPVLVNTEQVSIGVSASGMMTTTGAEVRCKKSILCEVDKEEVDLFELGKKSVPNSFEYATQIRSTYQGATFPDGHEINIVVPKITSLFYAFYQSKGLKTFTLKGNNDNNKVDCQQTFRDCAELETVDFTGFNAKTSNANQMCYGCTVLEEIKGELDFSECTNVQNIFSKCSALEKVRIKTNTLALSIAFTNSPNLSAKSVQSIIDGLATVETKQTLTLHDTVSSALTDEQYNTIISKNWELV